jgi:toxin ParE1/3/4
MRYRVSADAERDLDEIFLYWATRTSLNVADRLIENITDRFWLIGEHPDAGRLSEEMGPGVRCFPAGKYLVYYRRTRRTLDIPHVFHGARDQERALRRKRRSSHPPTL